MTVCDSCHGSGWYGEAGGQQHCRVCDGKGRVQIKDTARAVKFEFPEHTVVFDLTTTAIRVEDCFGTVIGRYEDVRAPAMIEFARSYLRRAINSRRCTDVGSVTEERRANHDRR